MPLRRISDGAVSWGQRDVGEDVGGLKGAIWGLFSYKYFGAERCDVDMVYSMYGYGLQVQMKRLYHSTISVNHP